MRVKHQCQITMSAEVFAGIDIEERILEAANNVFLKHGIIRSTMGQIAEEAGISRTLLNYYFRSKDHLIQKFLVSLEKNILPTISNIIDNENMSLIEKIETFVDEYMDMVSKYPLVPSFVLSEISRDPEWVFDFFKRKKINIGNLQVQIETEIAEGKITPVKFIDLFVNIIGLCIFPFLSKQVLVEFFFKHNEDDFSQFVLSHKATVKTVLNNWLIKT
jgi:TetR/AcrR family transcriptional regulator